MFYIPILSGLFFAITLALISLVIITFAAPFLGAPFVPSRSKQVKEVMDLAKIGPGTRFFDLGSGDGRFVIAAGKLGAKSTGIEINPFLAWFSRLVIKLRGLKDTKVIIGHLMSQDLRQANAIYIYLFPEIVKKLEKKFLKELKPGTIIISKAFPFPHLEPLKKSGDLYIYSIA